MLLLKVHVEKFQDDYEGMPVDLVLDPDDWHNLSIYVTSLKTLSDASDLLEGQNYPTASSVIPFLDQVELFHCQLLRFSTKYCSFIAKHCSCTLITTVLLHITTVTVIDRMI
jgi:hypothetical protein